MANTLFQFVALRGTSKPSLTTQDLSSDPRNTIRGKNNYKLIPEYSAEEKNTIKKMPYQWTDGQGNFPIPVPVEKFKGVMFDEIRQKLNEFTLKMKNTVSHLFFFWILFLNCCLLNAQGQRDSVLQKFERFTGTVKTKALADKDIRVYVFNQIIGERRNINSFQTPIKGLMIVQLRGGELKTVINGVAQERKEGEFWTVAAHQTMQFITDDDAATVQVIIIDEDSVSSKKQKATKPGRDTAVAATYTSYVPGVLRRKAYTSTAQSSFKVEIWDFQVALGTKTGRITFAGAAVLEIKNGSGRFIVDGKAYEFKTGSTIAVNEGSILEIETQRNQQPLNFRATVISSK